MGSKWLQNLCGRTLDEDGMKEIPYPAWELTEHVTTKTIQAFGLIGTMLIGPIAAVAKKETRNWPGIKTKMTRAGRNGVILGVVAGPLMTYMKIKNDEQIKVWDRCYRLRYNRGQVHVDQASVVGAAAGAGVGMATAGGAMFGGLVGMSSGILLAAVYNNCK